MTSGLAMTSCGSPMARIFPKARHMSWSTTASSAWTMCSIQMTVTPGVAQAGDHLDERRQLLLGQAAGDLVEQDQLGLRRESASELETLAIEQAQLPGGHVCQVGEAGDLQSLGGRVVAGLAAAPAPEGGTDVDVLEDGHVDERARDLEGARDAHLASCTCRDAG